ncbi:hypothetical protein MKQ70_14875 [Chitinophaga sedimenti]|uniref:hypothetical protein n=1 Tax=Chitinophaga sedimenti TaxID=2033606 RepID=UPI002006629E|nr:hypothetical protein [Chitinophaga sedimenti]MCK7556227.1 hypothetical protein [Chitinophaga sedimenti]
MKNHKSNLPLFTWNGEPWHPQYTMHKAAPPALTGEGVKLRVKNAVIYATNVRRDKRLREFYESCSHRRSSVHRTAVMDYQHGPVIEAIHFTGKRQLASLLIEATDNVRVDAVKVIVYDTANKQLETGLAIYQEEEQAWLYECQQNTAASVQVIAMDIPGNKTSAKIQFD